MKTKSAGDGYSKKAIEKTVLRFLGSRTFSHDLGGQRASGWVQKRSGVRSPKPVARRLCRPDLDRARHAQLMGLLERWYGGYTSTTPISAAFLFTSRANLAWAGLMIL